ncbi:Cu_bind_like domain-containing protein [Cephalotus follicularis]|uniref:Cu_bind_like domain-containing protein n=1 Tax=Cephalotus follicularis TaxID=3775 RepID=A0A1Q3CKB5_CEPFO|nr:Cu_bind_like domain-containing protein [Cephalotus follicularis]
MEQRKYNRLRLLFFVFSCLLVLVSFAGFVAGYKNYTVGDSLGWYDNTEKATVNYQKWASSKNFTLGDFLIFNTDNNHSVIQTFNFTTYKLCDYDDSLGSDTIEWSNTDPSNTATQKDSVAVPLLKEGMSYFFSGNYDGDQCKNGMHFSINVTHGKGLPESLKSPSDDQSPAPNSPDFNNGDSAPDTVVPSNFNHPHEESDVKADSHSVSLFMNFLDNKLNVFSILLGISCVF